MIKSCNFQKNVNKIVKDGLKNLQDFFKETESKTCQSKENQMGVQEEKEKRESISKEARIRKGKCGDKVNSVNHSRSSKILS